MSSVSKKIQKPFKWALFALLVASTMACRSNATAFHRGIQSYPSTPRSQSEWRPLLGDGSEWREYRVQGVDNPLNMSQSKDGVALEGEDGASGAFVELDWDIQSQPIMAWNWSLEVSRKVPDPMVLFVGFDVEPDEVAPDVRVWAERVEKVHGLKPPLRSIGYCFGSSIPMGVAESGAFGAADVFLINVEPYASANGESRRAVRDVATDYKSIFGEEAPSVRVLAFAADGRGEMTRIRGDVSDIQGGTRSDHALSAMSASSVDTTRISPFLLWGLGLSALACLACGIWLVRRFALRRVRVGAEES